MPSRSETRPGPRSKYRPKDRQRVLTFALTPAGHTALDVALVATRLSRSDYLEMLIRADVVRRANRAGRITQTTEGETDDV